MTAADELRAQASAIRAVADAQAMALERIATALEDGGDELVPLGRAAALFGGSPRILRDAAKRGELTVAGPRAARVVRRSDLDAWLASRAVRGSHRAPFDRAIATPSGETSDTAAVSRTIQRLASGGRS